jgi:ADP-ribose pyrophosphatase
MKQDNPPGRDLVWRTAEPELIYRTNIFDLLSQETYTPRGGGPHRYTIVRAPDWINVIPVTPEGRVVLIRQFRHGVGRVTLEVPGGEVDPGETPEACTARELQEETGFRAATIAKLGEILPNPAFMTNTCHTFLATGCVKAAEQSPEDTEAIAVELEDLARIPALIAEGRIEHSLVVVAFTHLSLKRPDLLQL